MGLIHLPVSVKWDSFVCVDWDTFTIKLDVSVDASFDVISVVELGGSTVRGPSVISVVVLGGSTIRGPSVSVTEGGVSLGASTCRRSLLNGEFSSSSSSTSESEESGTE